MNALVFHGPYDVRLEERPVPHVVDATDVVIKTTSAALCGSELHRYRGHSKINMQPGYVCGHEGMGIVHEVGSEVKDFTKGDHVIVPFLVSCNECFHCKRGVHGRCKKGGNFGGPALDGSQAQYFRVPLADTTLYHLPKEANLGELAILMTDIFPTGYNGAKRAFIDTPSENWKDMTIAVIGCGPVALCSIISALEYKPARIFAIDSIPSRLQAAAELGCIPLNFKEVNVIAEIQTATDNNGVHAVIEGVGLSPALRTAYDIVCPGGKISSFGVHNGELPFTAADCYNKNVHMQFGRCPLRAVFADALTTLIRNKELIEKMNFIDLVLPQLDESFEAALNRFERGELNKVVFKPNGLIV
ncbi:chaperonin 10-like protein [Aspergillus bertholletiae]|uniref:Chaperonin 10-like protein n=1 Tax=Aspergillus bertholletiae TaxID=1226010 RepID=A0A5N7B737_9EURO|nr:chaperonin 10-like protein [Aspergillus bertholletiae]